MKWFTVLECPASLNMWTTADSHIYSLTRQHWLAAAVSEAYFHRVRAGCAISEHLRSQVSRGSREGTTAPDKNNAIQKTILYKFTAVLIHWKYITNVHWSWPVPTAQVHGWNHYRKLTIWSWQLTLHYKAPSCKQLPPSIYTSSVMKYVYILLYCLAHVWYK